MAKSWSAWSVAPTARARVWPGPLGSRSPQELVVVPELVGEREDAEMLVGPADEAAVDVVQVAMDDQAAIERQHPRPDAADLAGDPLVLGRILGLPRRMPRAAEDHAGRVVEGLDAGDVGMVPEELGHRPRLGPAERVIARAGWTGSGCQSAGQFRFRS